MVNCLYNPEICEANKKYKKEKKKFLEERENDAKKELINSEKMFKTRLKQKAWKEIYPINNYDFDYKNYTINTNNPFKLGIKNNPTMTNIINSTIKMKKLNNTLLYKPTPNKNTKFGDDISDINNSHIINSLKNIKKKYNNNPLPYPSFLEDFPPDKYPTNKEHSSSYFIKVGNCPTKINNKNECENLGFTWNDNSLRSLNKGVKNFFFTKNNEPLYKNYEYKKKELKRKRSNILELSDIPPINLWKKNYKLCHQNDRVGIGECVHGEKMIDNINLSNNTKYFKPKDYKTRYKYNFENKLSINKLPKTNPKGFCYKPKFIYIDNSAKGFFGMKGYTNSMLNDILSITPDKLLSILSGKSNNIPTNCSNENFINYNETNNIIKICLFFIISYLITIVFKYL